MLLRLHVFLDVPADLAEASGAFWSAALGQPLGTPWPEHPAFRSFTPASGDAYVHQQIGDHGPRVHVDAEVDDRGDADRLVALGAVPATTTGSWQTLRSPGGLPFCLVDASSPAGYPPPLVAPDGHRSRLVQVSIDAPYEVADREVEFWRSATGWGWAPSDVADGGFAGKLYPGLGSPVHLLLQRLGADDGGAEVRAHVDLGTDDVAAEVDRLAALGAVPAAPGQGFVPMTDPVGMVFCVTGNRPD